MPAMRSADVANLINTRIDDNLISTLESTFQLAQFAEHRPLDRGQGNTVRLTFWNNPTISTAQADELATGNENSLGFTNVDVTVGFYANDYAFSEYAEAIDMTGSILSGHVGRTIYEVGGIIDTVMRDELTGVAATSVRVVNGKTTGTLIASDVLNLSELNHCYTVLDGRDVKPHPKGGGNYPGVFHPRNLGDMRADTGGAGGTAEPTWYDWSRRASTGDVKSAHVGPFLGVNILKSTNIQRIGTGGVGGNVAYYNCFIFGNESVADTSINSLAAPSGERGGRPLVKVIPKMFSHATPFANKIRVVFKFFYGVKRIDDTRMMMLQCASGS